jgi:hypothetical protein
MSGALPYFLLYTLMAWTEKTSPLPLPFCPCFISCYLSVFLCFLDLRWLFVNLLFVDVFFFPFCFHLRLFCDTVVMAVEMGFLSDVRPIICSGVWCLTLGGCSMNIGSMDFSTRASCHWRSDASCSHQDSSATLVENLFLSWLFLWFNIRNYACRLVACGSSRQLKRDVSF